MPQQQILQQGDRLYDPINKTFCNLENYKKVAMEREGATGSCGFQNSLRPVSSSETCVGLVPGQF